MGLFWFLFDFKLSFTNDNSEHHKMLVVSDEKWVVSYVKLVVSYVKLVVSDE